MTRFSRTKRFLAPLAERNSDVVYVRDFMLLLPVRHVVRGVCLGMTSMKGIFRPYWIVSDLIIARDDPSIEEQLFYSYPVSKEEFRELDEPVRGAFMCEMMDRVTLPYLRMTPPGGIGSNVTMSRRRFHSRRLALPCDRQSPLRIAGLGA